MPKLIDSIRSRGVKLNEPVEKIMLATAIEKFPLHFRNGEIDIYKEFDGFELDSADTRSQISIWPLSKVTSNELNTLTVESDFRNLVIGDLLIESDFVAIFEDGSINLLYEKTKVADSLKEFLEFLVSGKYDFI